MKFWEVKDSTNGEGELILYGEIRSRKPWWSEGSLITPDDFMKDIEKLRNKSKIVVRLNSGGGDVFAAQAIYTQLKAMKATVEIIIDGIAASAATIIAMAGDVVKIPKGAAFMIHNPSITVWDSFEARDLEQLKSMLDSVKACIIETYCTKTNLSKEELSDLMDQEVWLTGTEAVEKGFCDEIFEKENPVNKMLNNHTLMINNVVHNLNQFKSMPPVENVQEEPTISEPVDNTVQNKESEGNKMTEQELRAQYSEIINQIEARAKEEGAQEERMRIQDIEKIANTLPIELVNQAKFEKPINAQELAFISLQNEAKKGTDFLGAIQNDSQNSGVDNVPSGEQPASKEDEVKNKINSFTDALNRTGKRG